MHGSRFYEDEIRKTLQQVASLQKKTNSIEDLKRYMGTSYTFLAIPVPVLRQLVKKHRYSFRSESLSQQWAIWNASFLSSGSFEIMSQCLYFASGVLDRTDASFAWKITQPWVEKIDNWAHSDLLSGLYARLSDRLPAEVSPIVQKWSLDVNPWKRRQSLIVMILYLKKRKFTLSAQKMLLRTELLLSDRDYYVQKAVGWALREISTVDQQATLLFLKKKVHLLSAIAFPASVEKLSSLDVLSLKEYRRLGRLHSKHK